MATNYPQAVEVNLEPSLHFCVHEWGVADAFDDYLTEERGLEFFTQDVERDKKFVARLFFPAEPMSIEAMQEVVKMFPRK